MDLKDVLSPVLIALLLVSPVLADVTYWLDSSAANHAEIPANVEEAVSIYNKYGSFNKGLSVYYNTGIPTAEANYDGYMGFGTQWSIRTVLHEMGHTTGVGTYWGSPSYSSLMVSNVWQGFYGRKLALEMESGYADGLHGDPTHIWPWGLNYESEDSSFMERIKHVRIVAALRCDMGIMSYSKEAEHQIVPLGDTAIFGVASPTATSYQWYRDDWVLLTDGGDISGATRPTLQITNVDAGDAGDYFCIATGAGESLGNRPRRLIIQGQVGQWDLDGNADDSIGSYSGVTSGSPAYTTGKIGQAINLDGSDDFITLPDGVANAEDMTVAAWVYWDGGNQWQRIFDFGTSTSQNMFLTPRSGDNTLRFAIKNGGSEQQVNTTQLPTGQWVHLAVTLRNDAATLYVNGQAAASNGSVTIDPVDLLADRNYIGASQWPDPLFNGRIDDFRIYNYALSGAEVWNLWGQSTNQPPVFDADPVVLPDADESTAYTGVSLADNVSDADGDAMTFTKVSGPAWLSVTSNGALSGTPGAGDGGENTFVIRVADSSGATDDTTVCVTVFGLPGARYQYDGNVTDSVGTNHGTATGSPAYTTGVVGSAIDLDGSDDYITLPSGIFNIKDMTITAWVNWDGGGQWQRIFDFGNNTTQYMFLTPASGDNTLRFAMTGSGGGSNEQRLETTGLTAGQWTHVAVTLGGNTGKLYVNGQLEDINAAMTIDPSDFNPAVNYIGNSQWPDPLFNGQIDDFRIYGYALTADEIAVLSIAPSFTSDPISHLDGIELESYSGQSLVSYVDAQRTDGLTFSKVSGPEWLTVEVDGTLSGVPADSDVGENTFVVRVENAAGLVGTAQMTIWVANIYSGTQGISDLVGFAGQWLMTGCTDTPSCEGADLDGDHDVDLSDFLILADNWQND